MMRKRRILSKLKKRRRIGHGKNLKYSRRESEKRAGSSGEGEIRR